MKRARPSMIFKNIFAFLEPSIYMAYSLSILCFLVSSEAMSAVNTFETSNLTKFSQDGKIIDDTENNIKKQLDVISFGEKFLFPTKNNQDDLPHHYLAQTSTDPSILSKLPEISNRIAAHRFGEYRIRSIYLLRETCGPSQFSSTFEAIGRAGNPESHETWLPGSFSSILSSEQ